MLIDEYVARVEIIVGEVKGVKTFDGRHGGLHGRLLIDGPNLALQVIGLRPAVAVEDKAGDAVSANSAAMVADDVRMGVLLDLHGFGFLERPLGM